MSEDTIANTETTTEAPAEAVTEATAEATTPEVTESVTESEAATNLWYTEEYKDLVESKGFKSADDALKSYKNLEAMVGNSVRIPSEDASPEAKAEFLEKIKDLDGVLIKDSEDFFNKLGRPETAEDYNFEIDPSLAPSIDTELKDFQNIAHELGLTNEQAAKLVDTRLNTLKGMQEAQQAARDNAEAGLKKLWGEEYNNRLDAAKTVLKSMREKHGDAVDALINSDAGNNVAFLQMASELASMYKEKGHEGLSNAQFGTTPEEALGKIAEKRGDTGFMKAYSDQFHPEHKKAVSEMSRLYAIANGEKV